jgi:hypothetical protein
MSILTVGCPAGFGKDSRAERAVQEDAVEFMRKRCNNEEYDRFCGGAKKGTKECQANCGG